MKLLALALPLLLAGCANGPLSRLSPPDAGEVRIERVTKTEAAEIREVFVFNAPQQDEVGSSVAIYPAPISDKPETQPSSGYEIKFGAQREFKLPKLNDLFVQRLLGALGGACIIGAALAAVWLKKAKLALGLSIAGGVLVGLSVFIDRFGDWFALIVGVLVALVAAFAAWFVWRDFKADGKIDGQIGPLKLSS